MDEDQHRIAWSTDTLMNKKPTKEELMQVYVNYEAEQPTQLTQEALRCCQNKQIDYKELLPFSKDSFKNKFQNAGSSDSPWSLEQALKYHEIKKIRRVKQLAKTIYEEKITGIGIYSSPSRSQKAKRIMELATSNEE